jgi:hypothetical protein
MPLAGVQVGQYFDVLICGDGDTTDVALPTGTSIFRPSLGLPPVPDNALAGAVPLSALRLTDLAEVLVGNQFVKVLVSFTAPAVALPDVSFLFEIDELSGSRSSVTPRPRVRARVVKVVESGAGAAVVESVPVEAAFVPVVPAAPAAWLPHTVGVGAVAAGAAGGGAAYVPTTGYFDPRGSAALRRYDPGAAAIDGVGQAVPPNWFHPVA